MSLSLINAGYSADEINQMKQQRIRDEQNAFLLRRFAECSHVLNILRTIAATPHEPNAEDFKKWLTAKTHN